MAPRLFHVSDDRTITRFEPRPAPSPDAGVSGLAVWAVAESHLPNYLLPRDCPRICFRRGPTTTAQDAERFLGGTGPVVAFEAGWLARVRSSSIAVYELPADTFEEALPEAGYWISRETVWPLATAVVDDLLGALTAAGAEVRLLQDFWPLRDAVARSSLEFSIIRARNARPREG